MRHVHDAEPPVPQADAVIEEEAGTVGSAMHQFVAHPLEQGTIDPPAGAGGNSDAANATHQSVVAPSSRVCPLTSTTSPRTTTSATPAPRWIRRRISPFARDPTTCTSPTPPA